MHNSTGRWRALQALLGSCGLLIGLCWLLSSIYSQPFGVAAQARWPQQLPPQAAEAFVGDETCKSCHAELFDNYAKTAHVKLSQLGSYTAVNRGCESCHGGGKEHVEGGGDKSKIIRFTQQSSKEVADSCLKCHAGKEEHNNYRRGEHWRNDVDCLACHSLHSLTSGAPKMLTNREPELCLTCHTELKGEFARPFHHKVPEGQIKCSDCHNPHGGFEQKQLRLATGADAACLKCHTDKQGPFVYEHAPLKTEGCTSCHAPHGSNNPKLLKRNRVNQLCLECHSDIGGVGGPNTPSFHNQATTRYQNCTTCHVKIHGSQVDPVFFK